MRRSLLAIGAAVLAGVIATPMAYGVPSTGDTQRACADVVEGRAAYETLADSQDPKDAEVRAQMDLRAEMCKNVVYTMTVYASETDDTVLATVEGAPSTPEKDEPPRVEFKWLQENPAPNSVVCVAITTSKPNGKVLDAAPDTGCVQMILDSQVAGLLRFR